MNKELLNQLPADEQPVASKLDSLAEGMKVSPSFQWDLENQLMDAYKIKMRPPRGWYIKIVPAVGWAIFGIVAIFLLNRAIRFGAPSLPPAASVTSATEVSFEARLRQGDICTGPLALAHGFAIFLSNEDKTGFVTPEVGNAIDEVRSFAWSPDGTRLAVIGNIRGAGAIYITEPAGGQIEYLLSSSEVGYLRDAAWSRDGKKFVIWSSQNINTLYVLNADGVGLVEKQLDLQILGTPQFATDGKSIVFHGADTTAAGLFEMNLDNLQVSLINPSVEDESEFAFSPDGSHLAYTEYDRDDGEARLFTQDLTTGERTVLGTLPIPTGSGSSIPEAANLSWSSDGRMLVFEFGRGKRDRVIYLTYADGTGLVKVAEAAHAPAISADGNCLAYISEKQVFVLDLNGVSLSSAPSTPVLLADLPTGRGNPDFRLDKLQWRP